MIHDEDQHSGCDLENEEILVNASPQVVKEVELIYDELERDIEDNKLVSITRSLSLLGSEVSSSSNMSQEDIENAISKGSEHKIDQNLKEIRAELNYNSTPNTIEETVSPKSLISDFSNQSKIKCKFNLLTGLGNNREEDEKE